MTGSKDEHERTLAFAEIAFGQIKALRQPASPRYFEIWYAYATGYNPSLNQVINEMLARHGTLTEADKNYLFSKKSHAALSVEPEWLDDVLAIGARSGPN